MTSRLLKNYTVLAAVSTALAGIGFTLPTSTPFAWVLAVAYLLGMAWLASAVFFRQETPIWRIFLGISLIIAAWSALGGIVYHLFGLSWLPLVLTATLLSIALVWLLHLTRRPARLETSSPSRQESATVRPTLLTWALGLLLAGLAILMSVYGLALVQESATSLSIRSPWDVVPQAFFVIVFLAAVATIGLAFSGAVGSWAAFPLAALGLLSVSVTVLAYKVGFGFDPFIHQATERVIFETGQITPKPFYYAGQYALVTAIAKLAKLPLILIDRWLVPIGLASLIPFAGWCLKRAFSWPPAIALTAAVSLLLLPLGPFIATTPQGWANLLALAAFFAVLPAEADGQPLGRFGRWLPLLFAGASAVTHPLTGLPLLVFIAAWLILSGGSNRMVSVFGRWLAAIVLALLGSVVLPAAFIANSALSGSDIGWDSQLVSSAGQVLTELRASPAEAARRYLPGLDIAYFWQQIRPGAVWLMGLLGLAWLIRRRRGAAAFAVGLIALIGNWLLMKTAISLQFLIDYERASYANRLSDLILYLLAPLAAYALGLALLRIRKGTPVMRLAAVGLLATFMVSSVYLAYPRRDKYQASRGWSTSAADMQAVMSIDENADGQPYVVLANQSVSAAAIGQLGFAHYYQPDGSPAGEAIYFYPVPTGGPLYALFLNMNSQYGVAEVAEQAMDLTGVDLAYYVVNDYWWEARQIVAKAKNQSDKHWSVDGQDFVFRYER